MESLDTSVKVSKLSRFFNSWRPNKSSKCVLNIRKPSWKQSLTNFLKTKKSNLPESNLRNTEYNCADLILKREHNIVANNSGDISSKKCSLNSVCNENINCQSLNFDLSTCQANSFACITFYFIQDLIISDIVAETTKNGSLILFCQKTCSITVETPSVDKKSKPATRRKRNKTFCHKHNIANEVPEKLSLQSANDLSLTFPSKEVSRNNTLSFKRVVLRPLVLKKSASYDSIPSHPSSNDNFNKSSNLNLSPQNLFAKASSSCQKEIFVVSNSDATILENWVTDVGERKSLCSVDHLTTTAESLRFEDNLSPERKSIMPRLEISSHCNKTAFNCVFGLICRLNTVTNHSKTASQSVNIQTTAVEYPDMTVEQEGMSHSILPHGDGKVHSLNRMNNRGDNASKNSNDSTSSILSAVECNKNYGTYQYESLEEKLTLPNESINMECFNLDFKWLHQDIYAVVYRTINELRYTEERILRQSVNHLLHKMRDKLIKHSKIRFIRRIIGKKCDSHETDKLSEDNVVVFSDRNEKINYVLKDIISSFDSLAADKSTENTAVPDSNAWEIDQGNTETHKKSCSTAGIYDSDGSSQLQNETPQCLSETKDKINKAPELDTDTKSSSAVAKFSRSASLSHEIYQSNLSNSNSSRRKRASTDDFKPNGILKKSQQSPNNLGSFTGTLEIAHRNNSQKSTNFDCAYPCSVKESHLNSPHTQFSLPKLIDKHCTDKINQKQCLNLGDVSYNIDPNKEIINNTFENCLDLGSTDDIQADSSKTFKSSQDTTFVVKEFNVPKRYHRRNSLKNKIHMRKQTSLPRSFDAHLKEGNLQKRGGFESNTMNNHRRLSLTCSTETSITKSNVDSLMCHLREIRSSEDSKASEDLNDFLFDSMNNTESKSTPENQIYSKLNNSLAD